MAYRAAFGLPRIERMDIQTALRMAMPPITHRDLAQLKLTSRPFSRPGWIFEMKYDGFRVLAGNGVSGVRLVTRNGTDLLTRFPEIAQSLKALPPMVFDGELVVLDDKGRPQFDRLRRRFATTRLMNIVHAAETDPAVLFVFDLLMLRGKDLRKRPLEARKELLKKELEGSDRVRYVTHIGEEGERLFAAAEQLGLEGIVAKPAKSFYYRGRESGWLKIKTAAGLAIDAERRKWNES